MYESAQQAAQAQGAQAGPNPGTANASDGGNNRGDDVVDADFKEV